MPTSAPAIPLIASMATIGRAHEAWISDIWGVLHNGSEAYPAATEACLAYRREGGTIILVTNAPRPASNVEAMLRRLGIPAEAYDAIVTSGDVTRELIRPWAGRRVHHVGPDRQLMIFDDLDVTLADAETSDVVVCTGLVDDERETPEVYAARLAALRARNLEMICANPDLTVERGSRIVYCAGSLAEAYEKLGGRVRYAGKPHPPIYERAFALIAKARGRAVSRDRILAIGDGPHTDIAGAATMGLKSLYIGSALHIPHGETLDAPMLARVFEGWSAPPIAAQRALTW